MNISKIKERLKVENTIDTALSTELCEKAKYFFGQAVEKEDKKLLLYSSTLFLESLKLYSRNIEAYVFLAYISLSFGKYDEASAIIAKAEKFSPSDESVIAVRKKIIQDKKSLSMKKIAGASLSKVSEPMQKKIQKYKKKNSGDVFSIFKSIFKIFDSKVTKPDIYQENKNNTSSDNIQTQKLKSDSKITSEKSNFWDNLKHAKNKLNDK